MKYLQGKRDKGRHNFNDHKNLLLCHIVVSLYRVIKVKCVEVFKMFLLIYFIDGIITTDVLTLTRRYLFTFSFCYEKLKSEISNLL